MQGCKSGLAFEAEIRYAFRMTKTAVAAPLDDEIAGALAEVLPRPGGLRAYEPEQFARVLWRIAEGETVRRALDAESVKWDGWFYWLLRMPELERMHRIARRVAAFKHFDIAQDQIDKLIACSDSASQAKVRALTAAASALREMAGVLNPSEFGERRETTPPILVRIETTLNLQPNSSKPADHGSIYEIAAKTLGTVVAPNAGAVEVADGTDISEAQKWVKRFPDQKASGKPRTYERTIKEGQEVGDEQRDED